MDNEIKKKKLTYGKVDIMVTHDLDLAGEFDHVLYVQQDGSVKSMRRKEF